MPLLRSERGRVALLLTQLPQQNQDNQELSSHCYDSVEKNCGKKGKSERKILALLANYKRPKAPNLLQDPLSPPRDASKNELIKKRTPLRRRGTVSMPWETRKGGHRVAFSFKKQTRLPSWMLERPEEMNLEGVVARLDDFQRGCKDQKKNFRREGKETKSHVLMAKVLPMLEKGRSA